MIPPGCIWKPLRKFNFFSADDSNASWEPCDGEELEEDLSSPPRYEPGKEGGIVSLWLQGVRRLNPELNSRTLSVRIGVLPIHFVVDK